jgi:glycosyltransferase involved in cell wall biosynthesis
LGAVASLRRLGVNLLYLVPGDVGGSEIYARNLLAAITRARPDLELVAYVGSEALDSLRSESWAGHATFRTSPARSRHKPLRIAAELSWLPWRARRDGVDLLHSLGTTSPILCPVPSVVTVLDVIYQHFPETFPAASRLGLRVVVPAGARRARRVIAISEAGKRDLVETIGVSPERIDVVHLGFMEPPSAGPTAEAELRARFGLGAAPIVLTVAASLRHKNLARLIEAFAIVVRERDVTLVVAGRAGLDQEQLGTQADDLGIGERVRFTGWVGDRDLEGLYRLASAFVFPSLMEGFGMPVVEAMYRGVAVACSNVSAMPEVAGDAAELFDPADPDAIAAALTRLLDDPERRAELVARGHERWKAFSWERAAEETLEVYERALAQTRR